MDFLWLAASCLCSASATYMVGPVIYESEPRHDDVKPLIFSQYEEIIAFSWRLMVSDHLALERLREAAGYVRLWSLTSMSLSLPEYVALNDVALLSGLSYEHNNLISHMVTFVIFVFHTAL